ncbi:MAG: S8 family serine peptidase, partial [Candidatus Promineifilaceae bacterium]
QPPVIAALNSIGVEYRSYWVANMIWVRGDISVIEAMARRPDIAHIYANPTVQLDSPDRFDSPDEGLTSIEWNILKVNADDVWALGYNGQGAVVGGQDTGYDWDHPALKNQYRGWDGNNVDHNYNWHDSIHNGGGSCGADSSEPCDDHNHGTHTMGTIVGDDGGSNQIGMAPGARWVGCRNMDQGYGTPTTYAECYQWFIAPTNLNDENPDPSKAPHAINNSWSCPTSEGCTDPNVLLAVVDAVRAAGILTAHSAGNLYSDNCSTIDAPAAIYDSSVTVAAVSSSDVRASFSRQGPVTVDGSGRLKPDISAPGVNIRSSIPGGGYASGWSGTSMAAPHVAGQAALMISVDPSLAGQVERLESIMEQTAIQLTTSQSCGGIPGDQIPNNTFGYGRIDALAAAEKILAEDFNSWFPYLIGD